MVRKEIEELLPFFVAAETPIRAGSPEDSLEIYSATQQVDTAYERFRNLLDPGDEDILRRKAIVRYLNLNWDKAKNSEYFSLALLKNLARGRYIPSNTSRRYAESIGKIVKKSFELREKLNDTPISFFPLVAVEIDRIIYPREADDALVYLFFDDLKKRVVWSESNIPLQTRDTQLFLACHRALAKTDEAELFWHLFRTAVPTWVEGPDDYEFEIIANRYISIEKQIEEMLHYPEAAIVLRRLSPLAVPYRILRDILRQENAEKIINNSEELAFAVDAVTSKKVKRIENQMMKRVWHAAGFIFLTKGVLAIATEIPYEMLIGGIRYVPLIINLLFPPTLLFLMVGTVPKPGRENTKKLVQSLKELVLGTEEIKEIVIKSSTKTSLRKGVFAIFYGMITMFLFAFMIWVLWRMKFSMVAGFYFIMFLALVSFLGLRLRNHMKEVRVVPPRQYWLGSIFDFFTVPILDLGREISIRASQINIFLFILDAVIEAPFKLILQLIEEWLSYLRERKEELT